MRCFGISTDLHDAATVLTGTGEEGRGTGGGAEEVEEAAVVVVVVVWGALRILIPRTRSYTV
jgi:hypothetical protein